ncbi:MAG TPA: hypothetical protein VEQ58_14420 [Polyangiaceae bacterium]|nr:hypothetical protein [Polyangiaceae bacterium]
MSTRPAQALRPASPTTTTNRASRLPKSPPLRPPLPRASTERRLANAARQLAALLLLLAVWLGSSTARATPASVVVEIDLGAERLVDARSARRLVPLELADVAVPASGRGTPVLFFRVLGRESGTLRLELWERGEFHGARTLNGAGENPQLLARRVALAAAELGRRLARKREATLARDERLRVSREARARERRERTREGPLALRAELGLATVPSKLWLFGQSVSAEVSLRGAFRLDVGAELWGGSLEPRLRTELQGVGLGPAYRLVLTRALDLDLGLRAAAFVAQVPAASSLDGIAGQSSSWTAMLTGASRLELRLSTHVRAALGVAAGAVLRSVPYAADSRTERLRGVWLSSSLGIVVTPGN